MTLAGALLDMGLLVTIVWLAVRTIAEAKLFKSAVLFIALGLLTALAWVRLAAPDIALAEAAIGAGITGALLLDAVGHLRGRDEPFPTFGAAAGGASEVGAQARLGVRLAVGGLCLIVFVVLARGVLVIPESDAGLAPLVESRLAQSGVKSPVTAVLLNFRGYDTLFEIAVLILATIGVLSLRKDQAGIWPRLAPAADPVLSSMTRLLVPFMVLTSGYLLWAGEHAPGGAFQAGAVLGAAGVLLALSGYARPGWVTRAGLRFAIAIGFIVFLAIAVLPMFMGGTLLQYPEGIAKPLMLIIESWLTFSIGVILVSLFISSASPGDSEVK